MVDISDVSVASFDADGIEVTVVCPASKTKQIIIPSPPSTKEIPIDPRPGIIWLTKTTASEELMAYAKENKLVFILVTEADADGIGDVYTWLVGKIKKFNIIGNEISVKADADYLGVAEEAVEIIRDEADIDDAEVFSL